MYKRIDSPLVSPSFSTTTSTTQHNSSTLLQEHQLKKPNMSAITSSAARMVRAAAPLRTAAVRQFSASAVAETSAPAIAVAMSQHSTKKLAIVSSVAFVAGVDVTYAYFTLGQKSK